jgi:predicted lipid carrier protein YhbT
MKPTIPAAPALFCLALRLLPLAPLQPLLAALLGAVIRQHPRIFARLGVHAGKRFGIDPTDLPFALVLEPRADASRMTAVRVLPGDGLDARIAGHFVGLVGLVNGAFDGDALFFSRDIVIEGDVEAIVALRNAMDDAGVDIVRDAAACLWAFGPPFERAVRIAAAFAEELAPVVGGRRWN